MKGHLVTYGAYNMSGAKTATADLSGDKSTSNIIQQIQNSQSSGSTIVNTRVSDKSITVSGYTRGDNVQEKLKEFDLYMNKVDRALRISRDWVTIIAPSDITQVTLGGDASNKVLNTESYMLGSASIGFDIIANTGRATIESSDNAIYSIADDIETSVVDFWVYINDHKDFISVDISIGSDINNYSKSNAITSQLDDAPIETGWNLFSAKVVDMTNVGTPDFYSFGRYFSIGLNYGTQQKIPSSFSFGGIVWHDALITRSYKSYPRTISRGVESSNISWAKYTVSFLCSLGLGETLNYLTPYKASNVVALPYTFDFVLGGTYTPEPIITVVINSEVNLTTIGFTNLDNGDNVEITESWVDGDILVIDITNEQITLNNVIIGYKDVLPRFSLDNNRLYVYGISSSQVTIAYDTQNISLGGTV